MHLAELQRAFMESTLFEDTAAGAALTPCLRPAGQLDANEALEVYRNNTFGARGRALSETYPVIKTILGENYFRQTVLKYVRSHRPDSADLNRYGESFANFLEKLVQKQPELKDLVYLPNLAGLEWGWHRSFLVASESIFFDFRAFAALSKSEYENVELILNDSLTTIASPYPLLQIWNENRRGGKADSVMGIRRRQHLVIAMGHDGPLIEEVVPSLFEIITLIRKNRKFVELLDHQGSEHIPRMIEQRWIVGFRFHTGVENV